MNMMAGDNDNIGTSKFLSSDKGKGRLVSIDAADENVSARIKIQKSQSYYQNEFDKLKDLLKAVDLLKNNNHTATFLPVLEQDKTLSSVEFIKKKIPVQPVVYKH